MKTAFFLGAGASRTFGYPLTDEILPLILQRLDAGTLFNAQASATDSHRIPTPCGAPARRDARD